GMNPFHPATGALIALRRSAGSRDKDTIEAGLAMSSDALAEYGVPPEIHDVYSIGDRAEHFSAVDVIGAMYVPPTDLRARRSLWARLLRRDRPAVPPAHWAARTDPANTMIERRAAMRAHAYERAAVRAH